MTLRLPLICLISVLILILSFTNHKHKSYTFVQMCDTQLGMGGYQHDVKSFKQAVQAINLLNPDFVVICGDLVHIAADSSFLDFLEIKAGFNMPCHVAPGNHDVGNNPDSTSLQYYRERIGEDYYSFKHKGHAFYITNTQLWKKEVDIESKKHDQWFKNALSASGTKDEPAFVIGHFPLFTEDPDEPEHYFNFPLSKRTELLTLFTANNVKAYLSGHTHRTVVNRFENITLVSGETTSKSFDKRPLGFRLWHVLRDSIVHEFVPIDTTVMVD